MCASSIFVCLSVKRYPGQLKLPLITVLTTQHIILPVKLNQGPEKQISCFSGYLPNYFSGIPKGIRNNGYPINLTFKVKYPIP